MRLKKLSIYGFKSFAEKVTLQFDQGVTCIVGPNGCGKSNIADAFLWVLGEQSAKSLRGSKMPDVIFSGTVDKKPFNFAEVSLTLTDIQGQLPIDYDEMTLTRRLHRNGDSEYLINGNQVRLKDIQGLFFDSGISNQMFSSFQQGELDKLISSSPMQRRALFEEAAGIVRFQHRKKESLKRLEQADLNLSRVTDIYQEVEKQTLVLKVQAEKALRYKEKQDQLVIYDKASLILKAKEITSKITSFQIKLERIQNELESTQLDYLKNEESIRDHKEKLKSTDLRLRHYQEQFYKGKSQKEVHQQEISASQKRIQETLEREKKIKGELSELTVARESRLKSIQDFSLRGESIASQYQNMHSDIQECKEALVKQEVLIRILREKIRTSHRHHLEQLEKEKRLSNDFKQCETRLEGLFDKLNQNEMRVADVHENLKQTERILTERRAKLCQISHEVDVQKEKLSVIEEGIKALKFDYEINKEKRQNLQKKFISSSTRYKLLLKMKESFEGFSSGSRRLLQESTKENSPFFNQLKPLFEFMNLDINGKFLKLKPLYQHYEQTIVVLSIEVANKLLEWSKQEDVGDFSILCLEAVLNEEQQNLLKDKLLSDEMLAIQIAEHFLHHLSLIDYSPHLFDHLKKGKEYWLHSSDFFDVRGVYFHRKSSDLIQLFSREMELKELEKEVPLIEEEMRILDDMHLSFEKQQKELQVKRMDLDQLQRREEMKLVEINFGVQQAIKDQEKYKAEIEKNELDKKITNEQVSLQEYRLNELRADLEGIKKSLLISSQDQHYLQNELDRDEENLRSQRQLFESDEHKFQQLSKDHQQVKHQLNLLESKESVHDQLERRYFIEIEEGTMLLKNLEGDLKRVQVLFEELIQNIDCLTVALKEIELEKEVLRNSLGHVEKEYTSQSNQMRKLDDGMLQSKIQIEHYTSLKKELDEQWGERGGTDIDLTDTSHLPIKEGLESIEKQIRSLKSYLEKETDINLASIEELEQLTIRMNFLCQQMQDLGKAKNELIHIIKELETQSRKLFKTTFELIKANFKKNFQILFAGGDADLEFSESDDPLEAGIEITAKPPGKQMRSIMLLSGGEKCLTAVALLFAIFEVKPAPFCILDEIDAPLDDSNVERFLNVVRHFCDRCQFLIITHNKRTMAMGDALFGVSMEEKGISKLLSLEFSHEKEAPALVYT